MRKSYTILFFILALASVGFAQKFVAQTSKSQVAVGETFQISFTLNTSGSNFKVPNLKDFDVYSGPNQSTNMSFVNGSMSQTITLSYLLAPKKEGKVILGPASVTVEGKVIQSNSLIQLQLISQTHSLELLQRQLLKILLTIYLLNHLLVKQKSFKANKSQLLIKYIRVIN